MLSNQKSSRFYSVKGVAFIAIALALLMNVTAFASGNSSFAFIDSATEFFGLQSHIASVFSNSESAKSANSTQAGQSAAAAFVNVAVSMPNVSATPGPISIPITVGDLTGLGVISYDLNVDFNPAIMVPAGGAGCTLNACVTQTGTLSSSMSVTPNVANPGHFIISAFQGTPISPGGTLLILNFNIIGTAGQSTTVVFADYTDPGPAFHTGFTFNEGDPVPSPITNGSVTVPVGPTATATSTNTPTPSATNTPTPTNTATNTSTPTPSSTATNTSTPTPTPLCAQVDIDDKEGINGQPITLSVTTSDTTGLSPQAFSADFHISYDPSVLATDIGPNFGVALGPVGLSNSSSLTVSHPSPGLLEIDVFGVTPFSGSGSIVDITFPNVTGAPGTFSPVNFQPYAFNPGGFMYNEGFPSSCLSNGSVSVRGTVTGNVHYLNLLSAPNPRPVPNTLITASGVPVVTSVSDNAGNYLLSGFGLGSYNIVPTRSGASAPNTRATSITAFDASQVAQFAVGLIGLPGTYQQFAANVTGVQPIAGLDASCIARWAVSLPGSLQAGDWKFLPSSYSHPFVSNIVGEDYGAVLMGDVTGNWCDPASGVSPCSGTGSIGGAGRPATGPERATAVRAQNVVAPAGSDVVVPVTIQGAANKGIVSYQFDLRYDASVIQPQANAVTLGTISSDYNVVFNPITPGLLKVAVYGLTPLSDSGVLLNFNFTAVGSPFSVSPLTWENFMFNEGGIRMNIINGQVELSAAVPNKAAEDR